MIAGWSSGRKDIRPVKYPSLTLLKGSSLGQLSGIGPICSDLRTIRPVKTESVASCSVGVSVLRKAVAVLMMAVVGS